MELYSSIQDILRHIDNLPLCIHVAAGIVYALPRLSETSPLLCKRQNFSLLFELARFLLYGLFHFTIIVCRKGGGSRCFIVGGWHVMCIGRASPYVRVGLSAQVRTYRSLPGIKL